MMTTANRLRDALRVALRREPTHVKLRDGSDAAMLAFGPAGDPDSVFLSLPAGATAAAAKAWLASLAAMVEAAHDFAIEETPLEINAEGEAATPVATRDELEFFAMGLVPMPFPTVLFEYDDLGERKITVAAADVPDDPASSVTTFEVSHARTGFIVVPLGARHHRGMKREDVAQAVSRQEEAGDAERSVKEGHDRLGQGTSNVTGIEAVDPLGMAKGLAGRRSYLTRGSATEDKNKGSPNLLVYLLVMLGSTSTELKRVEPGKNAQRIRRAKGLPPARSATMVRLVPRAVSAAMAADGGGHGAWRQVHWRRSHERHIASGRVVVVPRHIVGYRRLDGTSLPPNAYVATRALTRRHASDRDEDAKGREMGAPLRTSASPP